MLKVTCSWEKKITIWLQEQVTFSMHVLDLQEQVNFIILKILLFDYNNNWILLFLKENKKNIFFKEKSLLNKPSLQLKKKWVFTYYIFEKKDFFFWKCHFFLGGTQKFGGLKVSKEK